MPINLLDLAREKLAQFTPKIEQSFNADLMWFKGPIDGVAVNRFINATQGLRTQPHSENAKKDTLALVLTTEGGVVTDAERIIRFVRARYTTLKIIVLNHAMSAGTIMAMAADEIYMTEISALGPIDPQVPVDGKLVPALGILDKYNQIVRETSPTKTNPNPRGVSPAEIDLIRRYGGLGTFSLFEQAAELSKELARTWLETYQLLPQKDCAKEIVNKLCDNNLWHTHGRPLTPDVLRKDLGIPIRDIPSDILGHLVDYHLLLLEVGERYNLSHLLHTRYFF